MIKITVKDLLENTNAKLLIGSLEEEINECFIDSRKVTSGGCFFGIKGNNLDGSLYYKEAFNNGARICVISKIYDLDLKGYNDKTVIIADDTTKVLQELARYKRSLFKGNVIGITGSVGKTTVKEMISSCLSKKYKVLKTKGNENGQYGLPLTILKLKDEDVMVLEMGVSITGEMKQLVYIARPNISVITNVLSSHIGNFGSRSGIFNEKIGIADFYDDGTLILNNDNDLLHDFFINDHIIKKISVGMVNESDVMPFNIKDEAITYFDCLDIEGIKIIGGKKYITNALLAISVAKIFKITSEDIRDALNNFCNVKHRLEIIKLSHDITLIDDSYNSSYESLEVALNLLSKFKGRKVAIIGDILELGNESKMVHQKIASLVMQNSVDVLITVGKYSKIIGKLLKKKGFKRKNIYHFKDKEKLKNKIINLINVNDYILIKASNGIKLFDVAEYIKNNLNKKD